MKIYYYVSTAAAGLCLLLSLVVLAIGNSNQSLQTELQKQQQEIQKQQEQINAGTTITQQVGPALVKDMASVALKNEKMKALLKTHGFDVQAAPTPAASPKAAPASKPAPADSTTPATPSLR